MSKIILSIFWDQASSTQSWAKEGGTAVASWLGNFRGQEVRLGLGGTGFKRIRRKMWCNLKARLDVWTWIAGRGGQTWGLFALTGRACAGKSEQCWSRNGEAYGFRLPGVKAQPLYSLAVYLCTLLNHSKQSLPSHRISHEPALFRC